MPSTVVRMKPDGLFGPGDRMRAMMPATKPTTAEVRANPLALWLDYALVGCLVLLVIAAPNSIAATQFAWSVGLLIWVLRFALRPRPVLARTPVDYALLGFFIIDCKDLEDAIGAARELAEANTIGSYEIRPVGLFRPGKAFG